MLDIHQVEQIADLAKLELQPEEATKMAGELDKVLGYIDELTAIDTEGVLPTAQVTGLTNCLRPDVAVAWPEAETKTALEQAPLENQMVKVNKIL
jgi:aspartyl-tRNA(Asn)/glutamyl-tRNA(Gln) amidotransferase subunit C